MKKELFLLRRFVASLMALVMLCALPLVNTSCGEDNPEPDPIEKPKNELPADAGTLSQTPLEDGTVELSVAAIERADSYRWYKDGEKVLETPSNSYIATESGVYKVAGVNEYGEGKASEEVTLTITKPQEPQKPSASVEAAKLTFNDIQITVDIQGVTGYYAGNVMTEAFVAEDILSYLETMSLSTRMHYEGALVDFPEPSGEMIMPGVSYTVWIVLPKEEADYTVEDIQRWEFTAPEFEAGGSIAITAGKPYLTQTEVEVDLTAEGAYCINYLWLSAEQYAAIDQTTKVESLLAGTQFEGGFVTAYSNTTIALEPESDVWLLALAIDQEGRYGELFEQKYTTLPEPKNFTLQIDEEACEFNETSGTIRWSILDGEAVETVYYLALADDNFWLTTLGESFDRAIEYISINPSNNQFKKVTNNYIEVSNLTEGRRYVFVAVAFDADGNSSIGDGFFFTPQSNVVFVSRYLEDGTENPEWAASCPTILVADYCFLKGQFTRLFWSVDMVEGTTGYTTAISASYVDESFSTAKAWAQDIMANTDDMYSVYYWVPDDPHYPDPNSDLCTGGQSISAKSTEVFEDKIYYHPRAHGDTKIYVTWKDAEGRLYECVSVDMPVLEAE